MKKLITHNFSLITLAALLSLAGCMEYGPIPGEEFSTGLDGVGGPTGRGLFIVCEGNYMYGNASLSYYDTERRKVENEVFARAGGMPLGDVAQSMVVRDGTGWVVVNNSKTVYALDPGNFREKGRITNLGQPRHIHFVSNEKAYITQIWDNRIFIVNPRTRSVTGYIETDMSSAGGSTEQMVAWDRYLFVNCWSGQSKILVVDSGTDTVDGEIEVGRQPSSMALDARGKLWVLTEGGGGEAPSLWRIDAETRVVEKRFPFQKNSTPLDLQLDGAGENLHYIDGGVYRMSVTAENLPAAPLIESGRTIYYALTVSPVNGDVYVADAIDYQQPGVVCRYSSEGELLDSFTVGIIPGSFCWL